MSILAPKSSETSENPQPAPYGEVPGGWGGLREIPAWAMSLAVHVLLLFVLASWTREILQDQEEPILSSVFEEEIDEREFKFDDAAVVDQLGNESSADSLTPSAAIAHEAAPTPETEMREKLEEIVLPVEFQPSNLIPQPSQAILAEAIEVQGDVAVHPGGMDGAIDRLTAEISTSLKERKTLVIWLFDESGSMVERRNAIADRFERIYKQLGMLRPAEDQEENALLTAVVGFSNQTKFYTPDPVGDTDGLSKIVRKIKPSKSPQENVFSTVEQAAKKWLYYRTRSRRLRRNVMMVIVTDEKGDDYQRLDDAIEMTRKFGIRCYCIGNAAVFGREKGYVRWTYKDGFTEDLPVDQGPETVAPERLQLVFWGQRNRGFERMSASFGPYALSRLCAETGGMYLVADEGRGYKFDPEVMREYVPDYRTIADYMRDLSQSPAKASLVQAARMTIAADLPTPRLSFRADNDNRLRTELTDAQRPFAEFDHHLNEILAVIMNGEKDREESLAEARWQAGYDLAMGRLLAMRVRTYGYNSVLAQMKTSPKSFESPGNNTWTLQPSHDVLGGPQVRKLEANAKKYLTRVIDEHPGTPWALIAEAEISQPMGWSWREAKRTYAPEVAQNDRKRILLQRTQTKRNNKSAQPKERVRPAL